MKLKMLAVLGLFSIASVIWATGNIDPMAGRNEMLNSKAAEAKWGRSEFDEEKFRKGTSAERAKMAVDLVTKNPYVGQSPQVVKSKLGEYSGYYWSHRIPAYLIEEGWNKKGDTWQVIFQLDINGKVAGAKIHKNCCYTASSNAPRKPTDNNN